MNKVIFSTLILASAIGVAATTKQRSKVVSETVLNVSACVASQDRQDFIDMFKRNSDGSISKNREGQLRTERGLRISANYVLKVAKSKKVETYMADVESTVGWFESDTKIPNTSSFSNQEVVEPKNFSEQAEIALSSIPNDNFSFGSNSVIDALRAGVNANAREKCENYRAQILLQINK